MHVLARICVQRPVFATVLSIALLVAGIAGYVGLGVDRYPNIDIPFVVVITNLPGASPDEIATEVSDKIERQVNTIGGIDELTSTSSLGTSVIGVRFNLEKDVDVANEEVRAKVSLAKKDLPPETLEPTILKIDIGAFPVVSFAISAKVPVRDIYEYVDKVVRRRLETVNGVGQVQIIGGKARQVNVVLDPVKMRAYQITPGDVSAAIGKQNADLPGGVVERGPNQLSLRTLGRLTEPKQFNDLPVKYLGVRQVCIRDIGYAEDGEARATSSASADGREAVVIQVIKQTGSNALEVVDGVKSRMELLQKQMPKGYQVQIARDQSTYIRASLNAVREHLVLGAILAALVVLAFLGSARSTIIASLAIPTSILATFGVMRLLGFTQNQVTLLALTLSVGIVIDDAIVVLENTFRVLEESHLSPIDAAIRATREIGLAVLAITLSLIAVFLPVAFLGGITGRFFRSFGITMACAVALSMYVSFTLTPMLCSRWLRDPTEAGAESVAAHERNRWVIWMDELYGRTLEWSLRHQWVVLVATVLTFISIPVLWSILPKNYTPLDDEAQFTITARAPEGTSLEGTRRLLDAMASDLRQLPEVRVVVVTVGDDRAQTPNLGNVFVRLNEVEDRRQRLNQFQIMELARTQVLPKYRDRLLWLSLLKAGGLTGSPQPDVQLSVSGPDLDTLARAANRAVTEAKKLPGVSDALSSLVTGAPELRATVDRVRAKDLGVNVADVAQGLRLGVAGDDKISDYVEKGEEYEVHIRLRPQYRRDASGLELLLVGTTDGAGNKGTVTLDQVTRFVQGTSPAAIERYNRLRQFTLKINLVPGSNQGAATEAALGILKQMNLGPAYRIVATGPQREFKRTFTAFLTAFIMSFLIMYLVVAAQFESFGHALVIMVTLPMTMPFAMISLYLTHESLNIFSMLGMLVLLGVVKKNAILQVDRANQLRLDGLSLHDATVQASMDRLRPILMTTLAFVAGMVPLVLARGTGVGISRATGGVIVGGQVLSLLLTLVAAPVLYVVFDNLAHSRLFSRFSRRRRQRQGE